MTTTHVSAGRRRRQRLRRVLLVVVALVVTVSGYAAWHDDGADATAQAGGASQRVGGVSTAAVGNQAAVPKPVRTDGS